MSIFCRHVWKEKERFFKGPCEREFDAERISLSQVKEIFESMAERTYILFFCEKCGKPKTIEVLGESIK